MSSTELTGGLRRILYVSKTHLDVGFTDMASAVRRRYLEEYFPRAIGVAAELRRRAGPARLRWTTGSWILHEALEAADRRGRAQLDAAIEAGDLTWHALPFTLHTEYADRSLVEHGLSLSARLDRRYGRRTVAAKVTDVPGHTRSLVSLLVDHGVELLHVGVNPASSPPLVPEQFRWRDPAAPGAPELTVVYQPGGYGALQRLASSDVGAMVDLTGDNLGPRDADDLEARVAELSAAHPGAVVVAASLDDVAAELRAHRHLLPVLDEEIGDSWIHGVASDPQKTAAFRALRTRRADWIAGGEVDVADPALRSASTALLLVAEHTWGLDQKAHWPDRDHWSASQLAEVRGRPDTRRFEASWAEQRALLGRVVDELERGGLGELAAEARLAIAGALAPPGPAELDLLDRVADPEAPRRLGSWTVRIDPSDGTVVELRHRGGRELATPTAPLGAAVFQTFDASDYERWFATYNAATLPEDLDWARWDNTKPGLERSGARSASWRTRSTSVAAGSLDGRDALVVWLVPPGSDGDPVCRPRRLALVLTAEPAEPAEGAVSGDDRLRMELRWWGMPAARWPQVVWWRVAAGVDDPSLWRLRKLGEWVDPSRVVAGGGRWLHVADELRHPERGMLDLLDAGLVGPAPGRALRWDDEAVDLSVGWDLCAQANLWGTNFPMWCPGDARFAVELS